jgi:hypothetical protein
MNSATLIGFVVVLTWRFSPAQTSNEKDALQFERDACEAFLDADVSVLDRVLTPDLTLTLSNGDVNTRADEINELHTGKSITTYLKTTTC